MHEGLESSLERPKLPQENILEGWKQREREVISLLEAFFYREFKCAKEGAPDGKRMRNTSGEHKEKGEKSGHIQ